MTRRNAYTKPDDEQLRRLLSPLQYEVTRNDATEPPFRNSYWDHHDPGLYVDVASGEPLFSSSDKFDSGTGWPSFTRAVDPERIVERSDRHLGYERIEVRSSAADSHLGHVFDDGPPPSGQRYCINSAALRFIAADRLAAEGYGEYAARLAAGAQPPSLANACVQPSPGTPAGCEATLETAILAGGCFWGMEDILRQVPGVIETEVGYIGGGTTSPTYHEVSTGATGHAEAVRVVFDRKRLSYTDLLEHWFFRMHDPTTPNRQANDVGTQYRSAIFVTSAEQRKAAAAAIERVAASGKWKRSTVTSIEDAGPFTSAEDYHQGYLEKHPGAYHCHYLRD